MKTSFWHRWCDSLRIAKRTPVLRARPRRQSLSLEALEDRVTPSLTPQMVLDINPNSLGSNPSEIVAIGSTTYFAADDGVHGIELWKTDGTAAGTVLVKDVFPGSLSSEPTYLTNVNGTLFFSANTYGGNGSGLWKSDGTEAGTMLVTTLAWYPSKLTDVNGTLFFAADDVNGQELWKSDGTEAGTTLVKDIYPGYSCGWGPYGGYYCSANGGFPSDLTNVNGILFFSAYDGTHGRELWQSDGTEAGTTLVTDLFPGGFTGPYGGYYLNSSSPISLTNVNGTLFFSADDGANGPELWRSDGTSAGTVLVKDIRPGSIGSVPRYLTNVNGTLFFSANDGTTGTELFMSDGTAAGTVLVKEIYPGSTWSPPRNLTNVNGTLFFTADDSTTGLELWTSDGTAAGTVLVKDINPGSGSSFPRNLTNVNGTLFFTADDGTGMEKLWQSDGTAAGTGLVANFPASSLTNVNGTLFFSANNGTHGQELWKLVDGLPLLTIGDVAVTEGNTGTRTLTFTVTLSAASDQPVTVAYATADGTATAGPDYQSTSGTLTIPAGETAGTFTVTVNGDRLGEQNETFFVNLSSPTNATIADSQGQGTILDDEPRLSITDVTQAEGNKGQTTLFTFTVTLSDAYDRTVTVSYRTANGTAKTANGDYVAQTGTLTFAPGETMKTITIEVKGDNRREADETFFVDLFGKSGNSLFSKKRGIGTILNDD